MPQLEDVRLYFPLPDGAITTVHRLAVKCFEGQLSCLILGTEEDIQNLDRQLWLSPRSVFLPHGIAGGQDDVLQPVLLANYDYDPNQKQPDKTFNRRIFLFNSSNMVDVPPGIESMTSSSLILVFPDKNLLSTKHQSDLSKVSAKGIAVLETHQQSKSWGPLSPPSWITV